MVASRAAASCSVWMVWRAIVSVGLWVAVREMSLSSVVMAAAVRLAWSS
jgi:hypothetical protein